ncbi:hypothetical protein Bca101_102127 [Brassica carinata]
MERGNRRRLGRHLCPRQTCLADRISSSHRHNLSATEIPANSFCARAQSLQTLAIQSPLIRQDAHCPANINLSNHSRCNQKSSWKTDETRPRPHKRKFDFRGKMVHRKVAEKSPKSHRDSPAIGLNLSIIVLHQALGHYPHPFDSHSPGRHRGVPTPYIDKTLFSDCPWVIFATKTVRQYTYQHVGPSRGLSGIVRQYAYQHGGPSRGLSAGDIRHEDCPRVIFATRTVRQYTYQHAGPSRGLSGQYISTHISTLALSVDYPWVLFAHEDCPWVIFAHEDCPWVIFAHEDCPSVRISARWPIPWTVRVIFAHDDYPTLALPVDYTWDIFAHEDCPRVIFAHEDCPSVRISARWPFPRLSGDFRHEDCPPVRISARWPFPWTVR